jgi:hypothetical protein
MTNAVSQHAPIGARRPADVERLVRNKVARASRQLVADALVTPILAQFRDSLQQEGVFGVTDAEKRLGPMIDQRVADSIVSRARLPIVDRVEATMLRRAGLQPELRRAPAAGGRRA